MLLKLIARRGNGLSVHPEATSAIAQNVDHSRSVAYRLPERWPRARSNALWWHLDILRRSAI